MEANTHIRYGRMRMVYIPGKTAGPESEKDRKRQTEVFLEEEYEGEQLSDHVWNEGIHAGGKDDRDKKSRNREKDYNRIKSRKEILCTDPEL